MSAPMHGGGDSGGMDHNAHHLALGNGEPSFAADMGLVHQLLVNHGAITRTVVGLASSVRGRRTCVCGIE